LLTFLHPAKCHTGSVAAHAYSTVTEMPRLLCLSILECATLSVACNVQAAAAQIIALVLQLVFQSHPTLKLRVKECVSSFPLYKYAIHFDHQSKMCTFQSLDNVNDVYFYSLCLNQSNIVENFWT
jgi:hypothetical protein